MYLFTQHIDEKTFTNSNIDTKKCEELLSIHHIIIRHLVEFTWCE